MEEKPILIYEKSAEPLSHKIIIPKKFVEKWGLYYYMELYEDKIILKPIKKEGK